MYVGGTVDKEQYSIVFFPGTSASPKRYQFSRYWFRVSVFSMLFIFMSGAITFTHLSYKYSHLFQDEIELTELRREAKIRKVQVEKISVQIKNFESEMTRLGRFEKKLRVITALEGTSQATEQDWGVGGSYGLSSHSLTTSLTHEAKALASKLSNDLGHLTAQAKVQTISFQELDHFFKNQKSFLEATPSIWPTRGWVTSRFRLP